ncbi:MAG: ORF6N domain-containing protein [Myxococcaceae bacterium]
MEIEISTNEVSKRIYTLRDVQVMLDSDLAEIYKVKTGLLNEAVKRNLRRFPDDFMFKTTKEELEILKSQIAISSLEHLFKQHGGSRHTPSAFTELGVAILSSVLSSERAIEINIEIMRAFVQLRKQPKVQQLDWVPKFESLEKRINQLETKIPLNTANPVSRIQNIVAQHWGLKIEDLKSARRTKTISLPRQIAIYLIRTQMQISFAEIGSHFGQRDHTTIMHAYRKIDAACSDSNTIREKLNFLRRMI